MSYPISDWWFKKKKSSRFFRGYPPRNQLATREAYATVANFGG